MSGATSAGSSSGAGTGTTSGNRQREGSSSRRSRASSSRTLNDAMREPSTTVPDVVVLESLPEESPTEVLDPKEDLWLSTVDGRYSSPIIPLYVGEPPHNETFYVHKHILLKHEYFEKALCGEFSESGSQSIHLPEEDPVIFHFLVAYLYEGKYEPIKAAATPQTWTKAKAMPTPERAPSPARSRRPPSTPTRAPPPVDVTPASAAASCANWSA
ncbi:hypothetical protein VTK26DRAFT_1716 [Humicola hyalothermophila]